jgi:hypothetical protein
MDVTIITAHRTPPHDIFGFEIKIAFNHPAAGLPTRAAAAVHSKLGRYHQIRMGGHGHNGREVFGQSKGRVRKEGEIAVFVEEMGQVGYPGSGHLTVPKHLGIPTAFDALFLV